MTGSGPVGGILLDFALGRGFLEVGIFGFIESMELQAGLSGVELEIEGGGLDGLLLIAWRGVRGCR